MKDRVVAIIDRYVRTTLEEAGEDPDGDEPFPADGIAPHELRHELYRHFGALVQLVDVAKSRPETIARSVDTVARSLIQQRERLQDLTFKLVEEVCIDLCPEDVHPDEWDTAGLEKSLREGFHVEVELQQVEDNIDKLIDRCWRDVEQSLSKREEEFGLYTFLFYVRQIYLREIDEQWIAHLKNIEQLRAGIGLIGYASRNPKNEYKLRGYDLFREMWDSIERSVLDQILQMRLSEEQKQLAEEGAEYETTLTKASRRRERNTARSRQGGELDKVQAAARRAVDKLQGAGIHAASATAAAQRASEGHEADADSEATSESNVQDFPRVGRNDPCPCGSGKRYKKCHGKKATG